MATKAEDEILDARARMIPLELPGSGDAYSMPEHEYPAMPNTRIPYDSEGEDGDYYYLIYPLDWEGPVWRGPEQT